MAEKTYHCIYCEARVTRSESGTQWLHQRDAHGAPCPAEGVGGIYTADLITAHENVEVRNA